jgi:hypothetical protein
MAALPCGVVSHRGSDVFKPELGQLIERHRTMRIRECWLIARDLRSWRMSSAGRVMESVIVSVSGLCFSVIMLFNFSSV